MGETINLPAPTREAVVLWLKSLDRDYVHNEGWVEVNKRLHPLAIAIRGFLQREFPSDEEREAAFDGLTLGLLAMLHFEDIQVLSDLFGGTDCMSAAGEEPSARPLPPNVTP